MSDIYFSLSRKHKKLVFVIIDFCALALALWSAFALRFGEFWPAIRMYPFWWMFFVIPALGVYFFARLGLYRTVIRFMGHETAATILKGVLLVSLSMYALAQMSAIGRFPRSIPLNFAIVASLYVLATRFLVSAYYREYIRNTASKDSVLIYGAGSAGSQLSESLLWSKEYRPVGFIDDNASLHGHLVHGLQVYPVAEIESLIGKYNIKHVLLAVPSASKAQRRKIFEKLQSYQVKVRMLPSVSELMSGRVSYEQLREVELDDLLGREPVCPDEVLLRKSISGKTVMVTGAGGSIGSELCRQILKLKPKSLVLYELCEFSLYSLENELVRMVANDTDVTVVAILGSVLEPVRVDSVIETYSVQTIFHAAAYKHVPMMEHNVLEGINNNIIGTKVVAEAALRHGVERFVFVSTDKAVRPSSVMGATKRVAEQVIQSLAESSQSSIFSMVRFGNVLGSSGSVVPLFRQQIEAGGPLTITHMDIVRYFMSIPEAAQLVIQAGAMARGGDIFVLDMGEPVKIYDLARNMIHLSGLSVMDDENPDGDIAIEMKGLRPGEKLFEELTSSNHVEKTEHVRIARVIEDYSDYESLRAALNEFEYAVASNEPYMALNTLARIVTDYNPSSGFVDHLGKHQVH